MKLQEGIKIELNGVKERKEMARRWKEGRCDYSASQKRKLSFEEPIDLNLKKKSGKA